MATGSLGRAAESSCSFCAITEVGAAGQSVEQRQPVGEDAGGERAQQQVLQRGFVGALVAAQEADQNVGRDRHQFQADEQQHDVVARGHAHHADDGEQDQRVELAVVLVLDFQVVHRHQDGDRGAHQEQVEEVDGEAVHQQRAHETGGLRQSRAARPAIGVMQLATAAAEKPMPISAVMAFSASTAGQHQVDQQHAEPKHRQQHHGQRQRVVGLE